MASAPPSITVSKPALWTGRIPSGIICLLLLLDSVMKFMKPQPVVDSFAHLGIPFSLGLPIATILLICVALYAFSQTSVLGAILVTGCLGGAVMTHLRAGDPLSSHALVPTYVGVIVWLGLYLRGPRLRVLATLRN